MASPSPTCTVQDNGGAPASTTNGVNLTPATTTTINLASTAGVNVWSITIVGQDELVSAPTLTVNNTNKTATFTAPAAGSALRFQSVVNSGVDVNGTVQASYTTTFEVYTLVNSRRVLATNETTEGNASFGWISQVNAVIRASTGTTPTGTGIPHIVGGSQNAAASLIVDADVSASAAIAGSKISPAFTGVTTSTTAYSAGTNPAATGAFRAPNNSYLIGRNSINTQDVQLIGDSAADYVLIGDAAQSSGNILQTYSGGTHYMRCGGNDTISVNQANLLLSQPAIGDSVYTSPYGIHGCVTVAGGDAPYTETAANYKFANIIYTGALTAGRTYTFPQPASLAKSYVKSIFNNTTGGFSLTFTTGAGTTVAIAATKTAFLHFDSTGVRRLTADV